MCSALHLDVLRDILIALRSIVSPATRRALDTVMCVPDLLLNTLQKHEKAQFVAAATSTDKIRKNQATHMKSEHVKLTTRIIYLAPPTDVRWQYL